MTLAVTLRSKGIANASEAELIIFTETYLEALIHYGRITVQVLSSTPFLIPICKCLLSRIHLRECRWEASDIGLSVGHLELIIEPCTLLMIIYRWNDE